MRKLLALLVIVCFCGICLAAVEVPNPTVAKIELTKPYLIKFKDFTDAVLKAAGGSAEKAKTVVYGEALKALQQLADMQLLLQGAEKENVTITDAELTKQIDTARQNMETQTNQKMSDVQFWDYVQKTTGYEKDKYLSEIKKSLIVQKYLAAKKKALFDSVQQPTTQEIQKFYELYKANFIRPDTIRVSVLIFDTTGKSDADKKSILDTAWSMVKDIRATASKFDEFYQKGKDPANTTYKSGDAGYFYKTAAVQASIGEKTFDILFNLRLGEVSDPADTERGIQIYKITESLLFKSPLDLTDPVQPGSSVTVAQYCANYLSQVKAQTVLQQALAELVAELKTPMNYVIKEAEFKAAFDIWVKS